MLLSQWWQLLVSAAVGALLGLAFFWGLWETVKYLGKARHPALWMLASMIVRFALALGVFFVLAQYGSWTYLLAGVLGFTLSRLFITRRYQWQTKSPLNKS